MALRGDLRIVARREDEGYRTRRKFVRDGERKLAAQVDVKNDRVHPAELDLAERVADVGDRPEHLDAVRLEGLRDFLGDEVLVLYDEHHEAVLLLTVIHGVPDSSLRT